MAISSFTKIAPSNVDTGNYSSSIASISEQTFVVEYIVGGQMCDDCRRVEANDTWNASVQVRQKGGQRKTLFYLEQLLIKYEATRSCSAIKPNAEGLDFFFGSESGARDGRISCFLSSLFPVYSVLFKKTVSGAYISSYRVTRHLDS